jgi:hypothetical protein
MYLVFIKFLNNNNKNSNKEEEKKKCPIVSLITLIKVKFIFFKRIIIAKVKLRLFSADSHKHRNSNIMKESGGK